MVKMGEYSIIVFFFGKLKPVKFQKLKPSVNLGETKGAKFAEKSSSLVIIIIMWITKYF